MITKNNSFSLASKYGTLITLFLVLITLWSGLAFSTDSFLTQSNLSNLVRQASINGIIAIGITLVIITGGIDLSVGSIVGFSGVIVALLLKSGAGIPLAVTAGLISGLICGVLNAFMIYEGNIPPFIATLGSMTMIRGLIKLVTNAKNISGLDAEFLAFAQWKWLMPSLFWVWIILAIIFSIILNKTQLGRNIFAIGSNTEVARLSGISLRFNIYSAYALCGLLSAIAGILLTSRVRIAAPTAGTTYELYAIAAAVIGGASLKGAEGSIMGAVLGALIMTTITNGGNLLNINAFLLEIIIGGLIVLAVFLDQWQKNKK